jgi:hypothetical protein
MMKRSLLAGVAAMSLLIGGQAIAQSTSVEILPDQRARIKEYVVKEKVKPVTIKERVTVGAVLPADIQLVPVPSTWGPSLTKYQYVYSDNHVVLVEPSSRKVIEIIN